MTNLEYINNKIIDLEDSLQHYTMVDKDKAKESYIRHDLEHLYKIKSELEAWEVVKDKITTIGYYDTQEDYEEDINEHKALCLMSNLKFQNSNDEDEWFIPLNEKEAITLKKALEVENGI